MGATQLTFLPRFQYCEGFVFLLFFAISPQAIPWEARGHCDLCAQPQEPQGCGIADVHTLVRRGDATLSGSVRSGCHAQMVASEVEI